MCGPVDPGTEAGVTAVIAERLCRPDVCCIADAWPCSYPKAALFAAALLAGLSCWPASHILTQGALLAAWKGAGVGLLAVWAFVAAPTRVGRRIAGVLACGAVGDVLLDTSGLSVGAVAFFIGHLLAAALYWRKRRRLSGNDISISSMLATATPLAANLLSHDVGVALYSLGLAAMVATAWISRFPRRWVGAGALLFAASDLLIFARIGPLAGSVVPGLLIWPLYLAGQTMIAYGVVTTERAR